MSVDDAVLDYVTRQIAAMGGQAVPLTQPGIEAGLIAEGYVSSVSSIKRAEKRLQAAGLLFKDNSRRGASLYQIAGGQMPAPTTAATINPRRPRGLVSGLVSPAGPGREIINDPELVEGSISTGAGRRIIPDTSSVDGPAADTRPDTSAVPPCSLCGPGSLVKSWHLANEGLPDVYYCAGRRNTCSYLYDAEIGLELMPPGVAELSIPDAADLARRSRSASAAAPSSDTAPGSWALSAHRSGVITFNGGPFDARST